MRAKEPLLVLASASPRRRELMKRLGYDFVAEPPSDPKLEMEGPADGEGPEDYVLRLSRLKARDVAGRLPGRLVVGADTVVVLGGEILGKPRDGREALEMLRKLSGRDHAVVTGVALLDGRNGREKSFAVRTGVSFSSQCEGALAEYAASEEPLDKAGAYAIQGEGAFLVRAIRGSYTNVVGLPLAELAAALRELLEDKSEGRSFPMRKKALVLLSGGLDSTLALKVMMELGFEVVAANFTSPFCRCNSRNGCRHEALRVSEEWGVKCRVIGIGQEYLDMVRNPAHGYGKNLNPCIDCRIMMFRKARGIMEEEGASFLVTGEVLGQRPMSQRRDSMHLIERESGLKGLILRPLCARLMPPTIPEKEGLIDREELLAISGRSRKPQMALAESLGVRDYPCPAGGCQLTNPQFARRLKDQIEHSPETTLHDVKLLELGRCFRLTPSSKAIVGRNEEENRRLLALARPEDYLLQVRGGKGPLTILQGEAEEAMPDGRSPLHLAAGITLRYSSASGREEREVRVWRGPSGEERLLPSSPLPDEEVARFRIG